MDAYATLFEIDKCGKIHDIVVRLLLLYYLCCTLGERFQYVMYEKTNFVGLFFLIENIQLYEF